MSEAPPSEKNMNGRLRAVAIPLRANEVLPVPIGPFIAMQLPTDCGFEIHWARICMICVLAGSIPYVAFSSVARDCTRNLAQSAGLSLHVTGRGMTLPNGTRRMAFTQLRSFCVSPLSLPIRAMASILRIMSV